MKIKVDKVRTWVPQGCRNGPQNHLKIDEKTHLVIASAAKPDFHAPGSIGGYPPCPKMAQKHTKKRVRQQRHGQNFQKDPLPLRALSCLLVRASFMFSWVLLLLKRPCTLFWNYAWRQSSIACNHLCKFTLLAAGIISDDNHPMCTKNWYACSHRLGPPQRECTHFWVS